MVGHLSLPYLSTQRTKNSSSLTSLPSLPSPSSSFPPEILTSFLSTLTSLMPQTNIRAYSHSFLFDYKSVFDSLNIFPNSAIHDPSTFLEDVAKQNLYTGPKNWGMKADLIVLGSCEVE